MQTSYIGSIKNLQGEVVWTQELKQYARSSTTGMMHQRALDKAAATLGDEAVKAEIVLVRNEAVLFTDNFNFVRGRSQHAGWERG